MESPRNDLIAPQHLDRALYVTTPKAWLTLVMLLIMAAAVALWAVVGEVASHGIRLNLLSLEAVAAARHLGAEICLAAADDNKPLVDAARRLDIPVRRLATTGLAPTQRFLSEHSVLDVLEEDRG